MYLAYPPTDVLNQLAEAWPNLLDRESDGAELARYRQAVLEWCVRNWPRIVADGADRIAIDAIGREFEHDTSVAVAVFESCAALINEPPFRALVGRLIDDLADLEIQRLKGGPLSQDERGRRSATIYQALTLLFLQTSQADLGISRVGPHSGLIAHLGSAAARISAVGSTLSRMLYLQVTRPRRQADPRWALESLAETLFRGRDPNRPESATHELLPEVVRKLIAYAPRQETLLLLQGAVNLFIASLEDLSAYSAVGSEAFETASKARLWVRTATPDDRFHRDPSLYALRDLCALDSEFCNALNAEFHQDVATVCSEVKQYASENAPGLTFETVEESVSDARTLAPFIHLKNCLVNVAVDAPRQGSTSIRRSKLIATKHKDPEGNWRLVFRVLTNFASYEETERIFGESPSGASDRHMLEKFGARFGAFPGQPDERERADGYEAAFELSVMVGFKGRTK